MGKERERDRGLNAGRKKQRLGTKVASAGETSEYGDAGADIEESRGRYRGREVGGVCKYFSSPHGKPGPPPFPASSFARLPPARIAVPCLFLRVAFLLSIARFSRHFFLLLSLSLFLSPCIKKMKARVDNRHALFISDLALFPRPSSFSPLCRVAFPSSYSRKRPGGFHRGRYTLCIVYLECWVNVSSDAEISKAVYLLHSRYRIDY